MKITCSGKINGVEPGLPVEVEDAEALHLISIGYAKQVTEAKASKPDSKKDETAVVDSPDGKE